MQVLVEATSVTILVSFFINERFKEGQYCANYIYYRVRHLHHKIEINLRPSIFVQLLAIFSLDFTVEAQIHEQAEELYHAHEIHQLIAQHIAALEYF